VRRSGGALIEFAFLAPLLLLVVTAVIEFGAMFFLQNNMMNVSRDTARRLAVGDLESISDAQTHAQGTIMNWGATFTVNITEPAPSDLNGDYVVEITVPMGDAALIDPFGILGSGTLSAESTMRREDS
jgi:Flp pilus assembly protein TadG